MRMLDLEYITGSSLWTSCQQSAQAPTNKLLEVGGQSITLGKPKSNVTYGWDNEYGQLDLVVQDFSASEYLVSNQEFMAFIAAGGYQSSQYWTEEGQQWLSFTKAKMPCFWQLKDNQYWQRNLTDLIPLPLNWPVEVNYLEAKAFCNWKDKTSENNIRLPTEAEWQVLRDGLDTDLPIWNVAPGNINLEYFASSCPVDTFKQTEFYDVVGNVWQWTESPIDGYEGFQVHPLYDDFSTPTFDGQHNLIKGGSWISTGNPATRDSRYAFRRHFHQHAGFRYVSSTQAQVPITPVIQCEMQTDICRMLYHHYGPLAGQSEHDLQQLMALVKPYVDSNSQVLDIGCGAGRLSFELAKITGHVQGIDFTARHIQHCLDLKNKGQLRFAMPTQGDLHDFYEVNLQDITGQETLQNLDFAQGDGHNLKPQFTDYDLVVCHRVIEFTYHPTEFLRQLNERIKINGVLVLVSSYAWDLDITEKQHWIGGVKQNGENFSSEDHLAELLVSQFELVSQSQVTSHYALDSRNSQTANNHLTVWRKKGDFNA
jgi:putative 4-mercaptohistidine N1-methyltranferase